MILLLIPAVMLLMVALALLIGDDEAKDARQRNQARPWRYER